MNLAQRIRAASSEQVWEALRAEMSPERWARGAERRATTQAACDKAALAADANPRATHLTDLRKLLSAEELELVQIRIEAAS